MFQSILSHFYFVIQAVSWIPFWLLFKFFLRFEVKGKDNLNNVRKPLLIVSNHISYLDAPLLYISLPLSRRIFPIRSIVWRQLLKVPVINLGMIAGGSFFVEGNSNSMNTVLKKPVEWLRQKGTLLIFPEGRRSFDGSVAKCKKGVSFLALNSDAQLLPVAIADIARTTCYEFVMRRRNATVIIGKPFHLRDRMFGDDYSLIKQALKLSGTCSKSLLRQSYPINKYG